ncbi:MAG: AraC family transcriptional regulator [Planctomycetes bacterium]|nr:AraC family transcriptional regulator [Planctomycetota bacterium]
MCNMKIAAGTDRELMAGILVRLQREMPRSTLSFSDSSLPPPGGTICMGVSRLHAVLEGSMEIRYCRQGKPCSIALEPGAWLYTPPHSWTDVNWDSVSTTVGVVFHRGFIRTLCFSHDGSYNRQESGLPPDHFYHTNHPLPLDGVHLLTALDEIACSGRRTAATAHHLMSALVDILVEEINRDTGGSDTGPRILWQRLLNYLAENAHAPIDRNTVAQTFHLHPNSISRLFHLYDVESFQCRLNRYRLERSCRMLQNASLNLEQIASACGFANANYYIKVYKKAYGQTPGEHRKAGTLK